MAGSLKYDLERSTGSRTLRYRIGDGLQAWRAGLSPPPTTLHTTPQPQSFGEVARGRQLLAGVVRLDGEVVEAPGISLWDIADGASGPGAQALHGFKWLDDLAALGGAQAQALAQTWLSDWIARFGRGGGPGWTPDLTAQRITRWIAHALFLLGGQGSSVSRLYFRALGQQGVYLSRRWKTAPSGRPRFDALTGMIYAGMSLSGLEGSVAPAKAELDKVCATEIGPQGGIASRNPEDLLEVLMLLTWAADALEERGESPGIEHIRAIGRIAPTLRALRHADGGLVRCHGGTRGTAGLLDEALSRTGVSTTATAPVVMGYARLSGGTSTVIADAAAPPLGAGALTGHASTLAFELTSGRCPLVVNSGAGTTFGPEWQRAARATASHSTLCLDGTSSSRLTTTSADPDAREVLADIPSLVTAQPFEDAEMSGMLMTHNGYVPTHGLVHARHLTLAEDGKLLEGTDTLAAPEPDARLTCDKALAASGGRGIAFQVRFHLAPGVDAEIDMGGAAVSLVPDSGEVWVFRASGGEIALAPSVYLERARLKPRATKQIVLFGRLFDYAADMRWSFTRVE
ncbi:heparinase II/III family protein [Tropicimonas sp. S265A]|uniref:heparinase II/III family protein n=1 Tax=Tropicimonas sp. S265A TaxID=3415134 RepID=UPI003C7D075C